MTLTETAPDTREITLEGAVESRLVALIEDALDGFPDGLIVRGYHDTSDGQTPAVVCEASRTSDADIPGWWRVDVSVTIEYRISDLTPVEADEIFRTIDEVMGETAPTLLSALPDGSLAVAGVEYDQSFTRERTEDIERRVYACEIIAGLIDPNQ
jgi:hypothetical protein